MSDAAAATPLDDLPLPRLTIGLVWHQMNSDNLGVGALTVANIELLRKVASEAGYTAHFLVLGWRDPRPFYFESPDVENVPLRLRYLAAPGGPLAAAIDRCDLVFDIGGGDSFTDIYGPRRFFSMWITKARTLWARKPLVLCPQTIGPFNTWWAKPLARVVMNRADFVVSRDTPSTQFLKQMQIRSPVVEATDVAMGLHHSIPPPRAADAPIKVGLNVSGLLFNGGYTRSNQFGLQVDYPTLTREIIGWFAARPEVELHLVPHVQSEHIEVEDDRRVSAALCAEFPGIHLAPVFASPNAAKSYIAEMDFFMGARMHATIAAFSAGVPVIPIAYSRKFIGVFGTLGYTHVADCKADSHAMIMGRIQQGYLEREKLAVEIARAMESVDRRLEAYTAQSRALIDARVIRPAS